MKGLLVKDWYQLKEIKRLIVVMVLVCFFLFIGNGGEGNSISFIFGYLMIMMSMMAVMTIGYDEMNNGFPFLMTFPVTRKQYVIEKYVLGILLLLLGWIFGMVLSIGNEMLNTPKAESPLVILLQGVIFFAVGLLFMSVSMPIQLKMGGEKGRIVAVLILMALTVAFVLGGRVLGKAAPEVLQKILKNMNIFMSGNFFIPVVAAVAALFVILSAFISVRIMEKKEF